MIEHLFYKNRLLMAFGLLNLFAAMAILLYLPSNDIVVAGVNSLIKPAKFALSQWLFCWTMAWIMQYLNCKIVVKRFSAMACSVLGYELVVITIQALRGQQSHFNQTGLFDKALAGLMGLAIVFLMLYTLYIGYVVYKQKHFDLNPCVVWSIKLAIPIFFIFSMEGGLMAYHMAHTIGAPDGGPGLPLANWSRTYGDLRVAHFMGIHALQVIPMTGYLISLTRLNCRHQNIISVLFSLFYAAFTLMLFIRAIHGLPLI